MIFTDFQHKVSKQDYSKKPTIDGVKLVDLQCMIDEGGSFCEVARLGGSHEVKDHFPSFYVKQINWSLVEPGAIKAGHIHLNQDDIWFVPPTEKLLVGLMDVRESSTSRGVKMRFVLGAGKARLLYIPKGVAHGCANLSVRPMHMVYFVNQYWSSDATLSDEYRIDYKEFGDNFWEIQKG